MTDRDQAAFWGFIKLIGVWRALAVIVVGLGGVYTVGIATGARASDEGLREVHIVDERQDSTLRAHQRLIRGNTLAVDSLRSVLELPAVVEEIRWNTCLTLMEVRGDANTDRCRRR